LHDGRTSSWLVLSSWTAEPDWGLIPNIFVVIERVKGAFPGGAERLVGAAATGTATASPTLLKRIDA
jgi:hypothetical protein